MRAVWTAILAGAVLAGTVVADEVPVLKVGHVGHDHQIALFIAADRGEALRQRSGGVWFRERKPFEVYDLMRDGERIAQVHLLKVGGGSGMPTALAGGSIEIGFGGVAATAVAVDKGADLRILAALNADGDMLMVRPDFPADDWAGFVEAVTARETPVRIGYKAPRAVAYLIFQRALTEVGIPYGPTPQGEGGAVNKVVLINLKGGKHMAPSLASKSVDGIVMNQPVIALAEANKIGKTIADLRDLPPKPRWHNHPCCCVAATKALLRKNPVEVEAFLQAVLAGQRYIEAEPQNAIEIAAAWTRKPLEVEQQSVPTVTYIAMPGQRWRTGMETWFEMMQQIGQFDGALKNLSPKEAHEAVSDYTHVRRAATHLPEAE